MLGGGYLGGLYLGSSGGVAAVVASGNLSVSVSATTSATLVLPTNGTLTATVINAAPLIEAGGAALNTTATLGGGFALTLALPAGSLVATVTLAISSGSLSVYVPSHNPGYQYVRDILSFGLPDGHRTYQAVGVPSAALGNNGDYYRRSDGAAGSLMYYRSAGSWSAIN